MTSGFLNSGTFTGGYISFCQSRNVSGGVTSCPDSTNQYGLRIGCCRAPLPKVVGESPAIEEACSHHRRVVATCGGEPVVIGERLGSVGEIIREVGGLRKSPIQTVAGKRHIPHLHPNSFLALHRRMERKKKEKFFKHLLVQYKTSEGGPRTKLFTVKELDKATYNFNSSQIIEERGTGQCTRINHMNVVKILGCCLATKMPILVYEFILNEILSQHLR
ncbi:hypothetical protein C2S52_002272 [Perilla frutescens var. hirtella]|nr:hypothetical protein C2S52_002272 [Perilla frutescens var. hirtella]